MGISGSKRVKTTLSNSPEFDSACDSAYEESLSLAQHAFAGVRPYQLFSSAAHIHRNLSSLRFPLIIRWVPSPPSQSQVDSALRVTISRAATATEDEEILGKEDFKEWAVEVFAEAVVGNARKAIASRIPLGIAGIAGLGAVTRSGQNLIGAAIGVYAIGVATSVFLSLSD
ncbi:hypothetical protein EUTSA_v10001662mg [Eutrema salsugineum]|uniref:Uncharacterized protein n=1 Tax=Eutrema salsugineum TaxID=72664 RepID=V4L9G4_EUTSA|nr:uncharacterized protein LOC18015571 [Eutrema salsugineum]ESQ38977.1 hypothetical protein EUTSA_v10001662mg [Eutrema salsugineum]